MLHIKYRRERFIRLKIEVLSSIDDKPDLHVVPDSGLHPRLRGSSIAENSLKIAARIFLSLQHTHIER